ncbi:hypothetical protein A4A49_22922 [Nicotiana attenuata]|uniref:Uncharacterized protein n=1 Tax=Nicotiana attenuata TaxID=49451 RepID=A0A1J6INE9_NICAT|nr:hypothetical protein A4A49_22922 [Nicotiana attenuata]
MNRKIAPQQKKDKNTHRSERKFSARTTSPEGRINRRSLQRLYKVYNFRAAARTKRPRNRESVQKIAEEMKS